MMIELIVTRHSGLVEYLKKVGMADDKTLVIQHATALDVAGKNVCGVLPHSLSCICKTFTEVSMDIPQILRGQELSLEQVEMYQTGITTYQVIKIEEVK